MLPSRSAALASVFFLACSTSQSSTPSDGGVDATAADGGGVCCPVADDLCCAADTGGWAQSAEQCPPAGSCDGVLYRGTDTHGCAFVRSGGAGRPGAVCCGCPTADAGDQ
ncbi:MAG TPA: hypothetical protein VIF62_23980 [Labilithrix sp.]|jgi:hypothetical protein